MLKEKNKKSRIGPQKPVTPSSPNSWVKLPIISGYVFDIKRFSVHDGPGIRTTVFLKGCPLTCAWCHNPESQSFGPEMFIRDERCIKCGQCIEGCPEGAITSHSGEIITDPLICIRCGTCSDSCPADAREIIGKEMTIRQVLEIITRDQIFYEESNGGVTFSGGEPLAQPGFLVGLLKECGERCVHRAVDTCGYTSPKILSETAIHTDLFLFDIKVMDPSLHLKLTGVDNRLILNNLRWLIDNGKEVIVRVPIIPGINDNRSNTDALASFLLSLSSAPPVNLLPFHELARGKHNRFGIPFRIKTDSVILPEKIEMIRKRLKSRGLTVSGEKEKYE